jgi:uncharacterized NAD(P)/FAD-binding protein YdhS
VQYWCLCADSLATQPASGPIAPTCALTGKRLAAHLADVLKHAKQLVDWVRDDANAAQEAALNFHEYLEGTQAIAQEIKQYEGQVWVRSSCSCLCSSTAPVRHRLQF